MYIENENWKYFKENTNYETRGICHFHKPQVRKHVNWAFTP